MKKCPFCAEDIQDEAIKCKHCGEWFNNKQENTTSEELAINSETAKSGTDIKDKTDEPIHEAVTKKKFGWGYGWFILLIIYSFVRSKVHSPHISSNTLAGILVISEFVCIILLFILFFWLRKRWLKQGRFGSNAPLIAGLTSFILIYIVVSIIISVTGILEQKANIKNFVANYQVKTQELRQEELKFLDKIISSPSSPTDLQHNIQVLDEYLVFMNKRVAASDDMINFFNEIGKRKKDNTFTQGVTNLKSTLDNYYSVSIEAISTLKEYYKTGDDSTWNKYEKLLSEQQQLEIDFKSKLGKLAEDML